MPELHYRGDLTAEFHELLFEGAPFGTDSTGWPYVVADTFLVGGGHDDPAPEPAYSTTVLLDAMGIEEYGRWMEAAWAQRMGLR